MLLLLSRWYSLLLLYRYYYLCGCSTMEQKWKIAYQRPLYLWLIMSVLPITCTLPAANVKVCLLYLYTCAPSSLPGMHAIMGTVLAMFLLTELPSVVCYFLTGIHGSFFKGTVSLSCLPCLPHSERNSSEKQSSLNPCLYYPILNHTLPAWTLHTVLKGMPVFCVHMMMLLLGASHRKENGRKIVSKLVFSCCTVYT